MSRRRTWTAWAWRLARAAEKAERINSCRADGLRRACREQHRAWYEASRRSGGGIAPEESPELSRALRGERP